MVPLIYNKHHSFSLSSPKSQIPFLWSKQRAAPIHSDSAMAKWILAQALCLLAALTFVAASEGPFIVAHKKASLTRLKSGSERVSVTIDVYNQGLATAYDLTLTDDSWSNSIFEIVSGNTSVSWEKLEAGTVVSHAFELEGKTKTIFYGAPAVIKFRIPTSSVLQEAYSTPILPLDVLADRAPEKKFDWAKRLLAKYGSLVSVATFVVLFIYLLASPSKSNASKSGKKKR